MGFFVRALCQVIIREVQYRHCHFQESSRCYGVSFALAAKVKDQRSRVGSWYESTNEGVRMLRMSFLNFMDKYRAQDKGIIRLIMVTSGSLTA